MVEHTRRFPHLSKRLLLYVTGMVAAACAGGQMALPQPSPATPARLQQEPDWQTIAGGKLSFEVASVREDPSAKYASPPFSLDADNDFKSTGGLFTADLPLSLFVSFAYKLPLQNSMISHLPVWAVERHYEIQARAPASATKDQIRLMMQSLLLDRFKLALHFEEQEKLVLLATLATPGHFGPRLRLHKDGPPCDLVAPLSGPSEVTLDMFPCHLYSAVDKPEHIVFAGARDTTSELMCAFFGNVGRMSRPVLDRTGITDSIDFSMEFTLDQHSAVSDAADAMPDIPSITFLDATKKQLGLKLTPGKEVIRVPVIDHLEKLIGN